MKNEFLTLEKKIAEMIFGGSFQNMHLCEKFAEKVLTLLSDWMNEPAHLRVHILRNWDSKRIKMLANKLDGNAVLEGVEKYSGGGYYAEIVEEIRFDEVEWKVWNSTKSNNFPNKDGCNAVIVFVHDDYLGFKGALYGDFGIGGEDVFYLDPDVELKRVTHWMKPSILPILKPHLSRWKVRSIK